MFAGIGGFRSGLEAVGGFRCVGYCEIDPYPRRAYEALYDTTEEVYYPDAREIDPAALPDLDLICGGFPCQSFSIAGRRGGFADTRGTLFFEIARIAEAKRPRYLLLENVPGLLSHCWDVEDYNAMVMSLGEDAMDNATIYEDEEEGVVMQ